MPVLFQEYCKGVGGIGCPWGGAGPAWGPENFLEELSTELKLEWTSQGGLVMGLGWVVE